MLNVMLVMNSTSIMSVNHLHNSAVITLCVKPSQIVCNVTKINVQSVNKATDNSSNRNSVFYQHQTVPLVVPFVPQMNVSLVKLDTLLNHGHHASTVLSCSQKIPRDSVRLFKAIVQPIQTAHLACKDNADYANKDSL